MHQKTTEKKRLVCSCGLPSFFHFCVFGFIIYIQTCIASQLLTSVSTRGIGPQLSNHLSDDVRFESRPQNTTIPVGSTLLAVKHNTIQSKSKLQNVRISTEKRIWLRIRDPSSSRRTLREDSHRIL